MTPPIPHQMRRLPLDPAGRPIPWFAAEVDGRLDFRLGDAGKFRRALRLNLCWVCGGPLGAHKAFVVGPMCAVNRVSSEPPSHRDCAVYSALACPFLSNPDKVRRTANLPEIKESAGGVMIERNPGVSLVWITRSYQVEIVPPGPGVEPGVLLRMGDPTRALWCCRGRPATRDEVTEAFRTGIPTLRDAAEAEGPKSVALLETMLVEAMRLVPS